MKLIIFLNNDIHSAAALRFLVPHLKEHQVNIILSRQVGNVAKLPAELVQMKEREKFAIEENFSYPAFFYDSVNSPQALADFKNFAPDLMISIRFGQIMKSELINIPRHGVLNLHSGILPQYRGVLASFWAILNGDKNIGTTLHYISDGTIDTGEIIAVSEVVVDRRASLITNISNLYDGGCELIAEAVAKIAQGILPTTIDQKLLGEGGYFSYPTAEDLQKFRELEPNMYRLTFDTVS